MAPGKGALTMGTVESVTVPSATVPAQVDTVPSLAPWVMATEELGMEVSIVQWVPITKDSSCLQDTDMAFWVTPISVGVPLLGQTLDPKCKLTP